MKSCKYLFGDIVVVDETQIGVVVKTWQSQDGAFHYDVYVCSYNAIMKYKEEQIERYRVRHKYLSEEELGWQRGQ